MQNPFEKFSRGSGGSNFEEHLDKRIEEYHDQLHGAVKAYDERLHDTTDQHYDKIDEWLYSGSAKKPSTFEKIVDKQVAFVDKQTNSVADTVGKIFVKNGSAFIGSLTAEDYEIWQQVYEKAQSHGVDHNLVHGAVNSAPSLYVHEAIKVGLDQLVWQQAQQKAQSHGVNHNLVWSVLCSASDEHAREAIEAGLDRMVWQQAQQKAQSHGVNHNLVQNILTRGSSGHARDAIKAGLDQLVWQQVQQKAQSHGVDHNLVQNILYAASNEISRDAMKALLPKPAPKQEQQSFRTENPFSGFGGDPFQGFGDEEFERIKQQVRDRFGSSDEFGRIFDGIFERSGGFFAGGAGKDEQPPYSPHESQKPSADQEAHRIIEAAINATKNTQGRSPMVWLRSAEKSDVKRVIATVKHMRAKAQEKDEEITDRDIYISYRRRVESEDASDAVKESLNILTALMGGKPNGKLPF